MKKHITKKLFKSCIITICPIILSSSILSASSTKNIDLSKIKITGERWGRLDDYILQSGKTINETYIENVKVPKIIKESKNSQLRNSGRISGNKIYTPHNNPLPIPYGTAISNPSNTRHLKIPNWWTYNQSMFSLPEIFSTPFPLPNSFVDLYKNSSNYDSKTGIMKIKTGYVPLSAKFWEPTNLTKISIDWIRQAKLTLKNNKNTIRTQFLPNFSYKESSYEKSYFQFYGDKEGKTENNVGYKQDFSQWKSPQNQIISWMASEGWWHKERWYHQANIPLNQFEMNLGNQEIIFDSLKDLNDNLSLTIYSNSQFQNNFELLNEELKNKIKERIQIPSDMVASETKKIKNAKLKLKNLNVKVNTKWEYGPEHGIGPMYTRSIIRMEGLQVDVNFDYQWSYDVEETVITTQKQTNTRPVYKPGDELNENGKLNNWFRNFNNSFPKGIIVSSDTGWEDGFWTRAPRGVESNRKKFEIVLSKWLDLIPLADRERYRISLGYNVAKDEADKAYVWLEFYNPTTRKFERKKLSTHNGSPLIFNESDYYLKLQGSSIEDRLIIKPGKYVDIANTDSRILVDDIPEILVPADKAYVQNDKGVGIKSGGVFRYHTTAKVSFKALLKENEILYVNDTAISVLNQDFTYDLKDLRLFDENDANNSAANIYTVKVVEYDKSTINDFNRNPIREYFKIIIIESGNANLKLGYFGWNPEKDTQHKSLISQYLLDKSGKPQRDTNGQSIINPKYDPDIDPESGTKRKLYWVNYLPVGTRFPQDVLDERDQLISSMASIKSGFIGEGVVVGKGSDLSIEKIDNSEVINQILKRKVDINDAITTKRWKIDNINDKFALEASKRPMTAIDGSLIAVGQEETKTYYSYGGSWMFTSRTPKGIDAFKLITIGNKNIGDVFKNTVQSAGIDVVDFWEGSIAGKHLMKYLGQTYQLSYDKISQLTYEQTLTYWMEYIQNNVKLFGQNIVITPTINEEALRNLAKESDNFEAFEKTTWKDFVSVEPKYQSIFQSSIAMDNVVKHQLNINFNISGSLDEDNFYVLDKNFENFNLKDFYFKQFIESNANKISINPVLDVAAIKQNAKNQRATAIDEWFNPNWAIGNFTNGDKVDYVIEQNVPDLVIRYKVKPEFKSKYWLPIPTVRIKNLKYLDLLNADSKYKDIFYSVPNEINLKGITDFDEAKKYVLSQIMPNIDKKYVLDIDYTMKNLDEAITNAISKIWKFNDKRAPDKGNNNYIINLRAFPDKEFIGSKDIFIFNKVANPQIPEIFKDDNDIGQLKFNTIKMNLDNFDKVKEFILSNLNQQMEKYNALFTDWMEIENFDEVINYLINKEKMDKNGFIKIVANIVPANFLAKGKNRVGIANNLREANNPNYDVNADPNSEVDLDDQKNNPAIGIQKTKSNLKKPEVKSFFSDSRNLIWFIPLMILIIASLGFLGLFWYYRYGRGAKVKTN